MANHENTSCPYFKLKAHSFTSEDHPLVICGSISTNFYGKKNTKTWRTSQWYQAAPNRFTFGVCLDAHHLKSKNGTGTNASATAAIGTWGVGGQSPRTWMVTVQAIWMQFAHGWCEYGMQSSCRVHMCWTRQLSFLLCWGGGICTDTMHCGRASGNWA